MKLTFIYEKQNVFKGVLYLHGWTSAPYISIWINGSLRYCDEALPANLEPGQQITCEAEFVDQSRPFATFHIHHFL